MCSITSGEAIFSVKIEIFKKNTVWVLLPTCSYHCLLLTGLKSPLCAGLKLIACTLQCLAFNIARFCAVSFMTFEKAAAKAEVMVEVLLQFHCVCELGVSYYECFTWNIFFCASSEGFNSSGVLWFTRSLAELCVISLAHSGAWHVCFEPFDKKRRVCCFCFSSGYFDMLLSHIERLDGQSPDLQPTTDKCPEVLWYLEQFCWLL